MFALPQKTPLIMGILNATPDSFSNGGRPASPEDALTMIRAGADILDVGGESTRPGATDVPVQEELDRVLPLIEAIRKRSAIPISVDTRKSEVALEAIKLGVQIINDASCLGYDPRMIEVLAESDVSYILMHTRGTPQTMEAFAVYPSNDVTGEVRAELESARKRLTDAGIGPERILIDPGFGFAKRPEHSIELLNNLDRLTDLGPVVVGISRKRFTGGNEETSLDYARTAVLKGAKIVRTHNVSLARTFFHTL